MADLADAVADHLSDPDYQGFVRTFRKMGAEVSEVRYDADGMAEILLAWPGGWQIVSPRQAIREQ